MGVRSLFIGTVSICLIPGCECAQAQTVPDRTEVLPAIEVTAPAATVARPARARNAPRPSTERAQGLGLSDRADADGGLGNGSRQGAGSHQRGRREADRAHRLAEHRRRLAAAGAGHHRQRHDRKSIYAGHPISRLRCIASRRYPSGTCGLPERDAHQRSVRRHRQLGPDPDRRDQVGHRRDQ